MTTKALKTRDIRQLDQRTLYELYEQHSKSSGTRTRLFCDYTASRQCLPFVDQALRDAKERARRSSRGPNSYEQLKLATGTANQELQETAPHIPAPPSIPASFYSRARSHVLHNSYISILSARNARDSTSRCQSALFGPNAQRSNNYQSIIQADSTSTRTAATITEGNFHFTSLSMVVS